MRFTSCMTSYKTEFMGWEEYTQPGERRHRNIGR
jgi:hypothetical protein